MHCIHRNRAALDYVFRVSQDPEEDMKPRFHIPLLKNIENLTALDYTMQMKTPNKGDAPGLTTYIEKEEELPEF